MPHAPCAALAAVFSTALLAAQIQPSLPVPIEAQVLVVAPNGNGTACSSQAPCSLDEARRQVRARRGGMRSDLIVLMRGGTYELPTPLTFDAGDSGLAPHRVVYAAAVGEAPILSGGVRIGGWTLGTGGVWTAPVPAGLDTRQIHVAGTRAVRASSAAGIPGNANITATGYVTSDPSMQQWPRPSDTEFVYTGPSGVPGAPWTESRCGVASITGNASATTITMRQPGFGNGRNKPGVGAAQAIGMPTRIENNRALLDQPGEWYLDRGTSTLHYMPREGEDMRTVEVVASRLETLLLAAGTPAAPVHDLEFRGLTFAHATWLRPNGGEGFIELQANTFVGNQPPAWLTMPANVLFQGARDVTVRDCRFRALGATGLAFEKGSQRVEIAGNEFTDIAGNALRLGDTDAPDAVAANQDRGFDVVDNHVHDTCVEFHGGVGVCAGYVADLTVQHNELVNLPYSGMSIGWGWGRGSYADNNLVVANRVENVMQMLQDGGAIYTLSNQPRSMLHANYLANSGVNGLYHDEGTGFYVDRFDVVQQALVYWLTMWTASIHDNDIQYCWYDLQNGRNNGTNNVVANNVFVGDSDWPATARTVIAQAGLEGSYLARLRGRDLSCRRPATASSEWSAVHAAARANDGFINFTDSGGWSPAATDAAPWLQIDLGAEHRITGVDLVTRQNGYDDPQTRRDFEVVASNDSAFTTDVVVLGAQGSTPLPFGATWSISVSDPRPFRFVRARKRAGYFFVAELRVLGLPRANVAVHQPATASSTYDQFCTPDKAVNDSIDENDVCGGWSPTSTDPAPWWQVDLGSPHRITDVELVTRSNGYDNPETRRNFEVRASNDPTFASFVVLGRQGPTPLPNKATWRTAVRDENAYRYVRATKAGYFFIAELRVFGSSTNVAAFKPARASTIYSGLHEASKANDASINFADSGGWSPAGSDANPWWQVDLCRRYRLRGLELVTRQNGFDDPETRRNFEVRASNDPAFASYVVLGRQGSTPIPYQGTWRATVNDPTSYRYLRATKAGYFFIAELRAFADLR